MHSSETCREEIDVERELLSRRMRSKRAVEEMVVQGGV